MSERYKREIEEILKRSGDLAETKRPQGPRPSIWRLIWLNIKQSLGGRTWSISPGRVMLVAVCLLLSALIVRAAVPGMVAPLAWAGLLLFIVGYAMFFLKKPGSNVEKRWRGQPIENSESWWDRLRRKLR